MPTIMLIMEGVGGGGGGGGGEERESAIGQM